jgi:hypothetical protein
MIRLGIVVHACNPGYTGGIGKKVAVQTFFFLFELNTNKNVRPYPKNN